MLSILSRTTVQVGNSTWEVHQDDEQASLFYITPMPQFALDDNGVPLIQLVTYQTSVTGSGGGYCQFTVELGVPNQVVEAITLQVPTLFPGVSSPVFQALAVQAGTIVNLTYPDGSGGTTGAQVDGTDFSSNSAIFQIPLDADQMTAIKATLSAKGGSPFNIEYALCVPAFMPGVTVALSFDANIAYNFQVTAYSHSSWNEPTTYTYDIQATLSQSDSTQVTINKVDPNLPEAVVDSLRQWGESVIEAEIDEQVKQAIALQQSGTGTQSFSVNELSSFTLNYAQNETVQWRLRPQAVLPSFADLALTSQQMDALQPLVDERKFIFSVLPNVRFADAPASKSPIQPSKNPTFASVGSLTRLDVTVIYPGMPQGTETFSFLSNTAHSWQAPWSTTQGGVCDLSYVATYENDQQVMGSVKSIAATSYTLGLADIGILNVTFDATAFFKANPPTGSNASVSSITVNLVIDVPQQPPYLQSLVLNTANPSQVVTSPHLTPLSVGYYYTLTYAFAAGTQARNFATAVFYEDGAIVRIPDALAVQSIPVLAQMGTSASPEFIELDINIFYDQTPYFPAIPAAAKLPKPSDASPISFELSSYGAAPVVRNEFAVFSNSNFTPLTLNATGTDEDGNTTTWGPVQFSPFSVTTLPFFKGELFTFIEFDPSIVDWKMSGDTAGLVHVAVLVKKVVASMSDGSAPAVVGHVSSETQQIAWDSSCNAAPSVYLQVTNLGRAYDALSVEWTATYLYTTGGVTTSGTTNGSLVPLPKAATAA